MTKFPERVFSGMQPTHTLHLGNYLGAHGELDRACRRRMPASIASSTCTRSPSSRTRRSWPSNIREVTAAYLACGLDPKRSIIFNQSQVHEHAELAWVFNCVARLGWLNRMTQFKEKAGKDRENASVGLYAYPNLMAADILAYNGDARAGRRGPEAASGARARHRAEIQQRFCRIDRRARARRRILPAAGADDHRAGDARHEPARRHQEDVEIGRLRLFAHQPDRRCRHDRAEDPEGEDRSRAAALAR